MKKTKRIAALLTAAVMSLCVLPQSALAEEPVTTTTSSELHDETDTVDGDTVSDDGSDDLGDETDGLDGEPSITGDGMGDPAESEEQSEPPQSEVQIDDMEDENGGISLMSLLPIDYKYESVTINRSISIPEEFENKYSYYVKEVLGDILVKYGQISDKNSCDKVIMYSTGGENYTRVEWNDVITPSSVYSDQETTAYFIVGDGDQLSLNNTRYTVNITYSFLDKEFADALEFKVYDEKPEEIKQGGASTYGYEYELYGEQYLYYSRDILKSKLGEGIDPRILVKLPDGYTTANVSVYDGLIYSEEEQLSATNITDLIVYDGTEKTPYALEKSYYSDTYFKSMTFVKEADGNKKFIPIQFNISLNSNDVSWYCNFGSQTYDRNNGIYYYLSYGEKDFNNIDVKIQAYYNDREKNNGLAVSTPESVEFACYGKYDTVGEATAAKKTDISEDLFSSYYKLKVDLSQYTDEFKSALPDGTPVTIRKVDVTAFDIYNNSFNHTYYFGITSEDREYNGSLSDDTYFNIGKPKKEVGGSYFDSYIIRSKDDSYYINGYQTVFILDGDDPVGSGTIYPTFSLSNGAQLFLKSVQQYSGKSAVTFNSNETVLQYYAVSENGERLKNYWVTFVTRYTGGAKLFVNGANNVNEDGKAVREVFLDPAHDNHHDILFANVGNAPLTGITVTLENAVGIKLDPYWQIITGSTRTLNPMDDLDTIDNIAKIRLIPNFTDEDGNEVKDGFGAVSGKLTITSNGGTQVIDLKGLAGVPKITNDTLKDGVKYVPYSSFVETNNMYGNNVMKFRITSGRLQLNEKIGQIYGVPKVAGSFTITVTATANYSGNIPVAAGSDMSSSQTYTIVIEDNTDENVDGTNNFDNQGADLTERIDKNLIIYYNGRNGDYPASIDRIETESGTLLRDEIFKSEGDYNEQFMYFYLDGDPLAEGQQYSASEGSTVITINDQTFKNIKIEQNSRHTIAAEFREGKNRDNKLTRSSQNIYLQYVNLGGDENDDNNGGGNGGNGINGSLPAAPSASGSNSSSSSAASSISAVMTITDKDGNAIPGLELELHSDPMKATTDNEGKAEFNGITFGRHTLYVKESGKQTVKKTFTIKSGRLYSVKENVITALSGKTVFLNVIYDGKKVTFVDAQAEDVSSGAGEKNDAEIIGIFGSDGNRYAFISMPILVAAIVSAIIIRKKKHKV